MSDTTSADQDLDSTAITLGDGLQFLDALAGTTVTAGTGTDTVFALSGGVSVLGGSGSLTFVGGTAANTVTGGAGPETIFGGSGGGVYGAGTGGSNVLISQGAAGARTTLTGGSGDMLFGSAAGNDVMNAQGNTVIVGGGGSAAVNASGGATVFGGGGNMSVQASVQSTVVGGKGTLTVSGSSGAVVAGSGSTSITTGYDAAGWYTTTEDSNGWTTADANLALMLTTATAAFNAAPETIVGGSGSLNVTGYMGRMLVVGGSGSSTISAGNGVFGEGSGPANTVFGGSGNMTLSMSDTSIDASAIIVMQSGNLTANSNPASIYEASFYDVIKGDAGGKAVLNGFRVGIDKINLFGYQASGIQVTTASGSTVLALSDGTKITLTGVTDPGNSVVVA